ncbi:MAG: hypothetical protein ACRD22_21960, partial [Terriglobia bacterium]
GIPLKTLSALTGPQLGTWPREVDHELVYALSGTVEHLVVTEKLVKRKDQIAGQVGRKAPAFGSPTIEAESELIQVVAQLPQLCE